MLGRSESVLWNIEIKSKGGLIIFINKKSILDRYPNFSTGESDFSSLVLGDFDYVDKTKFIRKWWKSGDKITLVVRPRRFSKSTVLSMVNTFFNSKNLAFHFGGTQILDDLPASLQGVLGNVKSILLNFKNIDAKSPPRLFRTLKDLIMPVFLEHEKEFAAYEKHYGKVSRRGDTLDHCLEFLQTLPSFLNYLYKKTDIKYVVLVDEYDKILADAAKRSEDDEDSSYFDEVLSIYRIFLTAMFKDTPFVERAILTGVLPLAANSVLSAFNNAVKDTFLDKRYDDIFGFTQKEVDAIFSVDSSVTAGVYLSDLDGYNSGDTVVFSPWSIINLSNQLKTNSMVTLGSWISTGNNDWVSYGRSLSEEDVSVVYSLVTGDSHTLRLNSELNYLDRRDSLDNFLTYAFYTGYLTFQDHYGSTVSLSIPNQEVKLAWIQNLNTLVYTDSGNIKWDKILDNMDETPECAQKLQKKLSKLLDECTSSWDLVNRENSYHMWILGMLSTLSGSHKVTSNREAGDGRFDIAVTTVGGKKLRNYVFELKKSNKIAALKDDAEEAIRQVEEQRYQKFFKNKYDMVIIGLAAHKKKIEVKIKIVPYQSRN